MWLVVVRIANLLEVELADCRNNTTRLIERAEADVPFAVRSCPAAAVHLGTREAMAFHFQFHLDRNTSRLS